MWLGRFLIFVTAGVAYFTVFCFASLAVDKVLNALFGIDIHSKPSWSIWVVGPGVLLFAYAFWQLIRPED